jgi:kanamycin kinase
VTEWEPVDTGKSGARVWRGPSVHRKEGDPAEIDAEADRLIWLTAQGIPCPEVVERGPGLLVTTTVPGRSAAEPWPAHLRGRMTDAFADLLRALHAIPVAACPFDRSLEATVPAAVRAAELGQVDLDDLDDERHGWSADRLVQELHCTRPPAEDPVVGHGDPCLPNVLFDDDGRPTGVVDVGRVGIADRYNDLAIATRSLTDNWHIEYGSRLLRRYGIERPDLPRIAFYRLLDEFF